MDSIIYISLGVFVAVIGLLVFIRSKTGNKYEVKNSDMVLGLLPIVLILLVSGKIESFEFGDLKVKAALVEASNKEILMQVSPLEGIPVRNLESASKGAVSQIPRLIQNKREALEFRLGHGGYYGPAIQRYFDALNKQSLLKYIIVKNEDGTFFGMYDAGSLLSYFENVDSGFSTQDFANWLNRNNKDPLFDLPGFIPSEDALMQNTNKSAALSAMEAKALDILPVINQEGYLQGIVEQSRLTASLILDVTKQLGSNTETN
jgi:hypothetical protein